MEFYQERNFLTYLGQDRHQDVLLPLRRGGVRPTDVEIMYNKMTSGGTDYGGCMGMVDGWDNTLSSLGTSTHQFDGQEYIVPNLLPNPDPYNKQVGVFYPTISP